MIRRLRSLLDRHAHPDRYAKLAEILPVINWSATQLAAHRQRAFDALVRYAAAASPFYRERLAASVAQSDRLIEPQHVPLLHKHEVVGALDDILARDVDRTSVSRGHTGGSTGEPMAFYYDAAKHELMLAGMMRGFMLSGWRPGQRVLYLWGASRDVSARGVFGDPGSGPLAVARTIAADEFSEARIASWSRVLQHWRPTLVYGYTSVLVELARFLLDSGTRPPPGLLGVYATAEMLDAAQRGLMQQAFGAQVFNQYGCREVPNIAWECRSGGLHVFSDMVHLESVGIEGEDRLVVTSLTDRVFPFIRYALGDTGRLLDEACPCGLPFPLMQTGVCRHNDLIVTPQGRRIHPSYFNQLLYGRTDIRQYQWVQLAANHLRLDLVSRSIAGDSLRDDLERRLRADLDPSMHLSVRRLEQIPRTISGKHRFVIGLQ